MVFVQRIRWSVAASPVADSLGIRTMLRACSGAHCSGYNESILVPRIDATACSCHIPQKAPGRITSATSFLYSWSMSLSAGSLLAHTRMSIWRTSTQRCESPPLPTPREKCVFEIKCPVCDQLVNNSNPHFDVQAFCAIAYVAGCSWEAVSVCFHRYRSHTDEPDAYQCFRHWSRCEDSLSTDLCGFEDNGYGSSIWQDCFIDA